MSAGGDTEAIKLVLILVILRLIHFNQKIIIENRGKDKRVLRHSYLRFCYFVGQN